MTASNIIFAFTTRIELEYNKTIDNNFIILQIVIYLMLLFILCKFQSHFWIFTKED